MVGGTAAPLTHWLSGSLPRDGLGLSKEERLHLQKQRQAEMRRHGVAAALLLEWCSTCACRLSHAFQAWRCFDEHSSTQRRLDTSAKEALRLCEARGVTERGLARHAADGEAVPAERRLLAAQLAHLYEKQELEARHQEALRAAESAKLDMLAEQVWIVCKLRTCIGRSPSPHKELVRSGVGLGQPHAVDFREASPRRKLASGEVLL